MTATTNFTNFYKQATSYLIGEINSKGSDNAAFASIDANMFRAGALVGKAGLSWVRASLAKSQFEKERLEMVSMDNLFCVQARNSVPQQSIARVPSGLRSQEFADYAKALSLPYLAKAIEAAISKNPSPAPHVGG